MHPGVVGRFPTFFTRMFPQELYHHFVQSLAMFKRVQPDVTDFEFRRVLKEARLVTANGREKSTSE